MLKKMAMNKMNDCDLGIVVGGTVGELEGLLEACFNNPFLKKFVEVGVHVPTAAIATAYKMEEMLDDMGISADISVGIGGTGAFSNHNKYYDRFQQRKLSQGEVEDRLRRYVA